MAIPLTVGRYQPARMTAGAGAAGGFQPGAYGMTMQTGGKPPSGPGSWYGGDFQHPAGGQVNQGVQVKPAPATIPEIKLPEGTAATPAYIPDYSSMIGGSYEVEAAESAMASQMAAARAAFQSQLRQSFIDLGYAGDLKEGGLGDFSKYIDKDTIQKAIDNKYSAYAQIKQQEERANAYNDAMLASSGLSLGGTTTATANQTVSQAEQGRYEGLRNFLSGGQQGLAGLAQLKAGLAAQVAQARAAAAARLASMYPPTPAQPAQPVDWNDYWGSYGGGVYSTPTLAAGSGIVPGGGVNPYNPDNPNNPYWVGPGSGGVGDLSWMYDKGWTPSVSGKWIPWK